MALFDLSNLTVDANGRVRFGGLTSGINVEEVVQKIITAKRVPVDRIETSITDNKDKITALEDLRGLLLALRDSLSDLRGAVTLGKAGDVFAAKQVFASTSRTDGVAPSAAGDLLGASATNAAATGTHSIEVRRVAAAHKVASKTFTSQTTALGFSGSFEITGSGGTATISVAATDTLQDIRDRINAANAGTQGTGVTASTLQVSSTQFNLVLTDDKTGTPMVITDTGTVLSSLGISQTNGAGGHRNGLADATSKIDATSDGFKQIAFDGSQGDQAFLISYDQATKVMTLTRGDGTTDTATLSSTAIASGSTERVTFSKFGATIVLDSNFDKSADITVEADAFSKTGGLGAIDPATIKITGSTGDISGITSTTLSLDPTVPAATTVSVGAFSGTFNSLLTGTKNVTLSDGNGNSLNVQFDVTTSFTGTETNAQIALNELKNLVASTGVPFDNELQAAQTARFTADGLVDVDRFESDYIASSSAKLSTIATKATYPGSFDIKVGAGTVTVNYDNTDTASTLVTKINNAIASAGGGNAVYDAGTSASLMTDGDGVRLVITDTSGAAITLTDTNDLLGDLGVDNALVVERSSNTVSDLFTGITLTLFQAEEGTTIKLSVEQNLASAKSAIQGFVDAYNAVKKSLNTHSQVDPKTGEVTDQTGVLFGTSAILGVTSRIASVFGQETQGVDKAFAALSQVGIKLVDNNTVADPLLSNTLEIDEAVLDDALLNNPDDVRRLFSFDFQSSDPRISLLGFTGATSYKSTGYKVNLNFDDRFQSQAFTEAGTFTKVDGTTTGPAGHGISAIAFDPSIPTGQAFRYDYDSAAEVLTLVNLTTGTSESVDITSTLDGIGNGGDLDPTETAVIDFPTLKVKLTLTGGGSSPFVRATDISTTTPLAITPTNVTVNGSATFLNDQDGGVTQAGLNDLKTNVASYDAATGLLTFNTASSGAGNLTVAATAGLEFSVDGGAFGAAPATNLDDGLSHTVDVRLASSAEVIGRATFADVDGNGAAGTLQFNVGTGLFAETSNVVDATAPMTNYLTFADGSFEIRDSSNTLLGTVNYTTADSLEDLASKISANVTNVTASVIKSNGTFKLEVLHSSRDNLTFTADTSTLVSQLAITDAGDAVYTANIDGASDGGDNLSATVNGRTITATDLTTAQGIKLFYSGSTDVNALQFDFTVGFGARLFSKIDDMITKTTGLIDSNINTLKTQNDQQQKRADTMLARLDRTRANLLQRFTNMEIALTQAQNLQQGISNALDQIFGKKKQ